MDPTDPFDLSDALAQVGSDITRPRPSIGTPETDVTTWDGSQNYADTGGIRSQEFILEQFTGVEIDEDALISEAEAQGWYTPGEGTMPQDLGKLLELHGVEVSRYVDANQWQLASELAQGHKVMIGVDSGELWGTDSLIETILEMLGFQLSGADHVVIVSGIDTSDPDNVKVIVSDPGTGEPVASYPMYQFLDAWKDSEFYMVATRDPAPAHLPEMAYFPYDAGHIDNVAGLPYDQFLDLQFLPDAWNDFFPPLDQGELEGEDNTLPRTTYPGLHTYPASQEPVQHTFPDQGYDQVVGLEYDPDYKSDLESPTYDTLQTSLDLGVFNDPYFDTTHNDDDDN
ncbi:MAG TPA: hypothetical protein VJ183_01455 [Chloroflexia bacterium]|nr:hypothetical protein [Chloroflexia bacterium]